MYNSYNKKSNNKSEKDTTIKNKWDINKNSIIIRICYYCGIMI